MNSLDYSIIGIILLSAFVGFHRGFIREALSLVIWLVAFWVASTYMASVASQILPNYIDDKSLHLPVAFLGLFTLTLLMGQLLGRLTTQLASKIGLGKLNQSIGALFGFSRGYIIILTLVMLADYTTLPERSWWKKSTLAPTVKSSLLAVKDYLPKNIASKIKK